MKVRFTLKTFYILSFFGILFQNNLKAQDSSDLAISTEYDEDNLMLKITLSQANSRIIPSNNFRIIISLPPAVELSQANFDLPKGFSFDSLNYTKHSLGIIQTSPLVSQKPLVFKIPIKVETLKNQENYNTYLVQIQQDEVSYLDPNQSNNSAEEVIYTNITSNIHINNESRDMEKAWGKPTTKNLPGESVMFYPNPVTETLEIGTEDWASVSKVIILTKTGNTVYDSGNAPKQFIDVRYLDNGAYIIKIFRKNGIEIIRHLVMLK